MQTLKTVGIVLVVILLCFLAQKYFSDQALKEKDRQINALASDTTRLYNRAIQNGGKADQLSKELETKAKEQAQRDQKFTEALSKTQSDVNRIAEWAESLDISRQIGEIAKKLPKPLQGDSLRIQRNYTPNDVAIIKELYKQIEEGKLYKGKYETAEKQVTDYRADNDTLKLHIAAYKRGYTLIQQRLLTVYQQRAFLNIGLGKKVLNVADEVGRINTNPNVVSDLEKELNGH